MQQLSLPGEFVKVHNELVRSKINISNVDASRILANLIACVRHDDIEFNKTYRISAKDFLSDQGGKSYTNIKSMCRELAKATAEIEESDPDDSHPYLRLYTFFSSITYRKGIIEARFNSDMKPLLLDLKRCFTQYNLLEYLTLPSIYSQRLFEILKSWSNSQEVTLSVSELNCLLNTPESFRKDFAAFRRFVLQKAYKDIHEKTSLKYEWEPVKIGRSVEKIRFIFSCNRRVLLSDEIEKTKEEKRRRLQTQRIHRALTCAKNKQGDCRVMDNRPIICKTCRQLGFCQELLKP